MRRPDLAACYAVLEIPADAPLRDVHAAFLRLKKLYSGESIATAPLGEEFPEERRRTVLAEIEEAYARILAGRKAEPVRPDPLFSDAWGGERGEPGPGGEGPYRGPLLRRLRERAGIELSEISRELKLRVELLRALEEERFEALPQDIYLKVHLKNYAAFLRLDPAQVAEDYLQRYREWKGRSGPSG